MHHKLKQSYLHGSIMSCSALLVETQMARRQSRQRGEQVSGNAHGGWVAKKAGGRRRGGSAQARGRRRADC
jgi:hypothetical protein